MNRIAILIGSPQHNLKGVYKDIPNIEEFLKSPMGGGWQDNEIIVLGYNPTLNDLQNCIKRYAHFDFGFIYFSGHGATNNNKKAFIALNQYESMFVNDLANVFKKQVTIIDACRGYESNAISGIGTFDTDTDERLKIISKNIFNAILHQSPQGRMLLFASQEGQNVGDLEQGGVFSIHLLKSAREVSTHSQYLISTLNEVYSEVKQQMLYTTNYQPELINPNNINLPFTINVQNFKQNIVPYAHNVPKNQNNFIIGGLIFFGVIGISAWIVDVMNKK